jgi:hypothetical protein
MVSGETVAKNTVADNKGSQRKIREVFMGKIVSIGGINDRRNCTRTVTQNQERRIVSA